MGWSVTPSPGAAAPTISASSWGDGKCSVQWLNTHLGLRALPGQDSNSSIAWSNGALRQSAGHSRGTALHIVSKNIHFKLYEIEMLWDCVPAVTYISGTRSRRPGARSSNTNTIYLIQDSTCSYTLFCQYLVSFIPFIFGTCCR